VEATANEMCHENDCERQFKLNFFDYII
jgi:hypothetical protein